MTTREAVFGIIVDTVRSQEIFIIICPITSTTIQREYQQFGESTNYIKYLYLNCGSIDGKSK